jgi:hypothetical protein
MANGRSSMVASIITSVVAAAMLSAGAAYVSVRVMATELGRAQTDVKEATKDVGAVRVRVAQLEAARDVERRASGERWSEVKRRLAAIESGQREILRALPGRRPR